MDLFLSRGRKQIESICTRQNKCDKKLKFDFQRKENIVEKGENAGYQHFFPLLQCFQKASIPGSLTWHFRSWDKNFTEILKSHPYTAKAF